VTHFRNLQGVVAERLLHDERGPDRSTSTICVQISHRDQILPCAPSVRVQRRLRIG
jgi:hypothetical protein